MEEFGNNNIKFSYRSFGAFVRSVINFDEVSNYSAYLDKIAKSRKEIVDEISKMMGEMNVKVYDRLDNYDSIKDSLEQTNDNHAYFRLEGIKYYLYCSIDRLKETGEFVILAGNLYRHNMKDGDPWDVDYHDIVVE